MIVAAFPALSTKYADTALIPSGSSPSLFAWCVQVQRDVVEAVRHMRTMNKEIAELCSLNDEEVGTFCKNHGIAYELAFKIRELKRLPVVNFAAGGIATPADAALMMQLGCDGVFVGSGIFKSGNPATRAKAIVTATANFNDPKIIAEVSKNLGEPMVGINCSSIKEEDKYAKRGL